MEHNNKIHWKGIEQLTNQLDFVKNTDKEFSDVPSEGISETNRRDFLKLLGFSMAAVSLAACEAPVKKAIPYLNKPENIDPTVPNYYASTYYDSNGGYSSILVKTREGRPIKIEGNNMSSININGTPARVQASLLTLYDNSRLKGPLGNGKSITWNELDTEVTKALESSNQIRIVSSTINSPITKKAIAEFISKYPNTQHIVYDAHSVSGVIKANKESFGQEEIPSFNYSKAEVIVSVGADFLGTWIASPEYMHQYAQTRKLGKNKKKMSRHYQFETGLSLTGANADYRTAIKPSQQGQIVISLYNAIAQLAGKPGLGSDLKDIKYLDKAAKDLFAAKGKSLVVCGSNDSSVQVVVNAINNLLENYGSTIDFSTPYLLKQGDDAKMSAFVEEVKANKVDTIIFYNANPVYDYPPGNEFGKVLASVKNKISFSDRLEETSSLCNFIAPDNHFLESWNDAEPKKGFYSLCQPTISPIFKTRQAQESLLTWAGNHITFDDYLKADWKKNRFNKESGFSSFEEFWTYTLHDGVHEPSKDKAVGAQPEFKSDLNSESSKIISHNNTSEIGFEICLYEKISIGTGDQANNPWLQEMPDPISKACWDNYAALSAKTAKKLNVVQGDVVKIDSGKYSIEVPVLIQPGQAKDTVSIAIGYGREKVGIAGDKVGKNAYPFSSLVNGNLIYSSQNIKISKTSQVRELAQTQTHETIMGRPVVQEAYFADYLENPTAGRYFPHVETTEGKKKPSEITLWHGHDDKYAKNHFWGMVIDLNSCIGCGACTIACQAENNIAVVGRQEVINRREMHWLRIDRYYSSDAPAENQTISGYAAMEIASENPEVAFQPMLCQHCKNAPCETVCPVLATTHSSEGLNQMTYNRCIGTRYCANNCPYKVRRFNWFKYFNNKEFPGYMDSDLGKMVLNPDVTVRSRGVIEKCSMCVQRIQAGKLEAKKERRKVVDGEILTACQQSCPTEAIVFGDMNNTESKVSQIKTGEFKERNFVVLEDINVQPVVSYLTKIRNKDLVDTGVNNHNKKVEHEDKTHSIHN